MAPSIFLRCCSRSRACYSSGRGVVGSSRSTAAVAGSRLLHRFPPPCSSFTSILPSRNAPSSPRFFSSLAPQTSRSSFPSFAASAIAMGLGILLFASPSIDPSSRNAHYALAQSLDAPAALPTSSPTPPPSDIASTASPRAISDPVISKSGRLITQLKVFVGYDSREDLAYEICRHSLLKHATMPVEVIPIKQSELRKVGLYTRNRDATESTEFSFTRFLTPYLAGYDGWAMFVDCDFLYTADVRELVELIDDRYAIMCVQHDYTPKTATKMDGVVQTAYPRKNWSSMVLYNCSHPKNRVLTPAVVNSQSGAFLHRFMWLDDKDIGAIPFSWNFLVGHNETPEGSADPPKAIHYTLGGPWFEAWHNCDFADLWHKERDEYMNSRMMPKVIQDEMVSLLDSRMADRAAQLEDRVASLESKLKKVAALQRLLFFNLQERVLQTSELNVKEVPAKPDDHSQFEHTNLRAAGSYRKE